MTRYSGRNWHPTAIARNATGVTVASKLRSTRNALTRFKRNPTSIKLKNKMRNMGTQTITESKRKRYRARADGAGENMTVYKTIKYKLTKLNKFAKFIGAETVHETQGFNLLYHENTDIANSQKVKIVANIFDSQDTQAIMNIAYSNIAGAAPLNSNATTIIANQSSSYKFFIQSCHLAQEWTNMSAGESTITFYLCMAKNTRSTGLNAESEWGEGLDDASGLLGQTAVSDTVIGNVPTQSKLFNMQWKIADKKTFKAQAGAKVNYNFTFKPQSIVDSEYWARHTYVKGMSFQLMVVTHGQLGLSQHEGELNTIIPKPVQWIYTSRKRYTLRTINHYARNITQVFEEPLLKVEDVNPVQVMEDDGNLKP